MNHVNKQTCGVIFDCLKSDKVKEEDEYGSEEHWREICNYDVSIIAYHYEMRQRIGMKRHTDMSGTCLKGAAQNAKT